MEIYFDRRSGESRYYSQNARIAQGCSRFCRYASAVGATVCKGVNSLDLNVCAVLYIIVAWMYQVMRLTHLH